LKLTRLVPATALLVGGAALFVGVACGGDDDKGTATPSASASAAQQQADTPTSTASSSPTPTITPTPSPTPYNGDVKTLKIPRFNVSAPVEQLDLDATNTMETPKNENVDVGWYYRWDKPGRANPDNAAGWAGLSGYDKPGYKGNSVFSAHIYYHENPAPFQNLQKVVVGDDISVVMEDGREYHYKVIKAPQVVNVNDLTDARMTDIIWPSSKPADKEWITLISCGGDFDPVTREYYSRVIVIAERSD
jgi:hypothetical protein